jgi:ribose 5-phosphate isomerase
MNLTRLALKWRALKARSRGRRDASRGILEVKRAATAQEASAWREQETEKRAAAQRAAGLIRPGMVVRLGSGIIVVDHTKCSPRLGTWHSVPLEVATFGWRPEVLYLEALGAMVRLHRGDDGSVFRTDQGNWILDAGFGPIEDPAALAASLLSRAAVAEVGLFCGLASDLIIATCDGVGHRERPQP